MSAGFSFLFIFVVIDEFTALLVAAIGRGEPSLPHIVRLDGEAEAAIPVDARLSLDDAGAFGDVVVHWLSSLN